jgi:hypothetical protein
VKTCKCYICTSPIAMSKLPTIGPAGAQALDAFLSEHDSRKVTPAIFCLATNAKETIYCNQLGQVVFGDEASGQVNADTGEPVHQAGLTFRWTKTLNLQCLSCTRKRNSSRPSRRSSWSTEALSALTLRRISRSICLK